MDPSTTKIIVLLALAFVIIQLGHAIYLMARPQANKTMRQILIWHMFPVLLVLLLFMLALTMEWITLHAAPPIEHAIKKNALPIVWLDTNRLQV